VSVNESRPDVEMDADNDRFKLRGWAQFERDGN
jgi:hypothetical protein